MVNKNEEVVVEKYKTAGWKVLRGGAPDFLMLKVKDNEIKDSLFVEVKTPSDALSYEQTVYRKALEKLGAKYKVEVVQETKKVKCPRCGYEWTYRGKLVQATCPSCGKKIIPTHTNPGQTIPRHSRPHQSAPAHSTPSQARPCHARPPHAKPRHSNPSQPGPDQAKPFHSARVRR